MSQCCHHFSQNLWRFVTLLVVSLFEATEAQQPHVRHMDELTNTNLSGIERSEMDFNLVSCVNPSNTLSISVRIPEDTQELVRNALQFAFIFRGFKRFSDDSSSHHCLQDSLWVARHVCPFFSKVVQLGYAGMSLINECTEFPPPERFFRIWEWNFASCKVGRFSIANVAWHAGLPALVLQSWFTWNTAGIIFLDWWSWEIKKQKGNDSKPIWCHCFAIQNLCSWVNWVSWPASVQLYSSWSRSEKHGCEWDESIQKAF